MNLEIKYNVERNPVLELLVDGNVWEKILCIGDPHLGRRFITGVPSHRLYEREETQYAQFNRLLNPTDPLIRNIVIMGDLFDRFIVSPTTVLRAIEALKKASENNAHIQYHIIPGNHDMSKDNNKKSSYELFYEVFHYDYSIVECNRNVAFSSGMMQFLYPDYNTNPDVYFGLYFEAYNAFRTPEYKMEISDHFDKATKKIAFGHWDSVDIIGNGYIPSKDLLEDCDLVVSGHEHTYKESFYPSSPTTKVLFTGSMQPYSHAEDPEKDIYVTVKAEDLDNYDLSKDFKYKCLRIECAPSFALTEAVECYSLAYKVIAPEESTVESEASEEEIQTYADKLISWVGNSNLSEEIKKELSDILTEKEYLN